MLRNREVEQEDTEVSMDVGSEQEIVTEVLYTVVVDSGMLLHQIEWSRPRTIHSRPSSTTIWATRREEFTW